VVWRQSPRLTAGTLVVLSPRSDNFNEQCFVAVVAARYRLGGLEPNFEDGEDTNTPPRIEIFWSNVETAVFDPSVELVMLEAKGGYFETVRHAMVGLQHAAKFE
jgi:helicase required for RNAi-mediated heterochromatin assembly 1